MLMSCGGCGDATKPSLISVTGTVTKNGKPVDKAQVAFINDKAPRHATGETDAQGKFRLGTLVPGDGAVAGDNVVIVTKSVSKATASNAPPSPEELAKTAAGGMKTDKVDMLPALYADPKTSPLRATIKGDGKDDFTFDLKD